MLNFGGIGYAIMTFTCLSTKLTRISSLLLSVFVLYETRQATIILKLEICSTQVSNRPLLDSCTTLHGPISFPLEHNSFATVKIKLFEYEWKEFWIETRLRLFSLYSLKCRIDYKKLSTVCVRQR